jgi:phosphatidylglycerol---prolipoprotein diacylglyceryl transferase
MYPTIYDLVADLFGVHLPFLKIVQSFGFMVAISFLLAHLLFVLELKRKEKEGQLKSKEKTIIVGKPYPLSEYLINSAFGFIVGFKFIPLVFFTDSIGEPRDFLLSTQGNFIAGLIVMGIFIYFKYREDKKQRKEVPETKKIIEHPYQLMGNITLIAAVSGIIGAKIFHNLENWDEFMADPVEGLLSFSGLTFFGGLIFGAIGVMWYASRNGIKPLHILDIGAPAMMLTYATGRIGCHVSGDGDWGIVNTAPKPGWLSWAPDWFWSYNYPNNVNGVCNPYVPGTEEYFNTRCNFEETPYLIANVFPTPLYEIIVCSLFFLILWKLRKKIIVPGVLFGIYMIMAGVERFFIEKIRVNTIIEMIGIKFTQAEMISVFMVLGGIALILYSRNKFSNEKKALG